MGRVGYRWSSLHTKQKASAIALACLFGFSIGYVGIGYVIASQAMAANPGCGIWSDNTPSEWTSYDDWESFEPWPLAEERVEIRRDFDVSPFQMGDYEDVSFHPRDDSGITLRG